MDDGRVPAQGALAGPAPGFFTRNDRIAATRKLNAGIGCKLSRQSKGNTGRAGAAQSHLPRASIARVAENPAPAPALGNKQVQSATIGMTPFFRHCFDGTGSQAVNGAGHVEAIGVSAGRPIGPTLCAGFRRASMDGRTHFWK